MKNRAIKSMAGLIGLLIMIHSCTTSPTPLKRSSQAMSKTIFYGIKGSDEKDSLLSMMLADLNTVFDMPVLNMSKAQNEMRIFYINAFGSLFFRQQFTGDSTVADLYVCSGENRNDSLFLKLHHKITVTGKYQYNEEFNAAGIRDFFQQLEAQKADVLDDISQFTVQLKNGAEIKYFLIDKPFSIQPQTPESRFVANIVKQVSKDFNFNFNSSVKGILDSAMKRPYGNNCSQ